MVHKTMHSLNNKGVIKINHISNAIHDISKARNFHEASKVLFDFVESLIDYKMAVTYGIDYDKKELIVLSARGTDISHLKKRAKFKIGGGVVGWVAKEKKAIILEDALSENRLRVRQYFDEDPIIRSYIAVPLINSGDLVGILSISHDKPHLYKERDAQIISIIASQIATLIGSNKMLLRTKQISNHFLQSINSGVIAINNNLEIIIFNKMAEKISKFSSIDVINKKITEVPFSTSYKNLNILHTLYSEEPINGLETFIINKEGKKVMLSVCTSILRDENNKKIGATAIFRDITDLKLLQQQMKRSEQLALMGKFAIFLSHEIRNPLLPIRTASNILLKKQNLSKNEKKLIEIICKESERLNNFLSNLLKLSRPTEEAIKNVNISEVICDVYELLKFKCVEKNIFVKFTKNSNIYIKTSPNKLKQVFLNLFLNSIDAIDSDGLITINAVKSNEKITITFTDDGCGLSELESKKIFDLFYTTKADGFGLGLSIVKKIVWELGGEVNVKSRSGQGTKFIITFPLTKE